MLKYLSNVEIFLFKEKIFFQLCKYFSIVETLFLDMMVEDTCTI